MAGPKQGVLRNGASSGFGRLIAETLARKKFQVFPTMRDLSGRNAAAAREIAELAKRESLSFEPLELDVTEDTSVERAVSKVLMKCGRIDVLVNNASYGIMDLAEPLTIAQAQRLVHLTFFIDLPIHLAVLS